MKRIGSLIQDNWEGVARRWRLEHPEDAHLSDQELEKKLSEAH